MAHECPVCYSNCHCGGDIDDICFGVTDHYCTHCDEFDNEDDEDYYDEDESDSYERAEPNRASRKL